MDQPLPPAAPSTRTRLKWWGLILLLTFLFAAALVTAALQVLRPAFESVDQLDPARIESIRVFVINRPDGGPDIGGPTRKGIQISREDFGKVLDPLRHAERVSKERGVWLGQMTVKLADGRGQPIYLYRARSAPDGPWVLRFKIGRLQYEAGPVDELVRVLTECEPRAGPTGPG